MAKDEFVEINLKLTTAYAVIGSDQPLLQVAKSAVCQRHHGLGPSAQLDSQGLTARYVLEPSFVQPGEALEAITAFAGNNLPKQERLPVMAFQAPILASSAPKLKDLLVSPKIHDEEGVPPSTKMVNRSWQER